MHRICHSSLNQNTLPYTRVKMLALLAQILLLVLAAQSSALSFATVSSDHPRDQAPGNAEHATARESILSKKGIDYGQSPPTYKYAPPSGGYSPPSRGCLPPQSPPTIRYQPPSQSYPPSTPGHPPSSHGYSPPIHRHPPPSQYPLPTQRGPPHSQYPPPTRGHPPPSRYPPPTQGQPPPTQAHAPPQRYRHHLDTLYLHLLKVIHSKAYPSATPRYPPPSRTPPRYPPPSQYPPPSGGYSPPYLSTTIP
ncbi:pollen-specific leucine-rich repeat extensin-like protein 3 [Durio zibethinus]|uniref:Pollen-specific leucine-rich repeat extensin-like protein 3 n=1 Tax=Durio zibethinus TaxID=66656 RepID=A0A6P5XKH1_DURZI|nr:pollen-specific leucine-rich repeat extensin-like protein 3 [Durio zibethinus]